MGKKNKSLMIVESPAKVRTIERFVAKGFKIKATMGHIRDLPVWKLAVDIEHSFKPEYEVPRDKKKVVQDLAKAIKPVSQIYIATDEDREGEAIGWHVIKATGAENKEIKRVVFHEITRQAVLEALKKPRQIDMNLVNAQQARRILDRLVGYKISPLLAKNVRRGLSAGRVQSVALRLIVEREREIEKFEPVEYWSIIAELQKELAADSETTLSSSSDVTSYSYQKEDLTHQAIFQAFLISRAGKKYGKLDIKTKEQAENIISKLKSAEYIVDKIATKEKKKKPAPPFITSTLQQEASRRFGFSAKKTMVLAQQLYEGIDLGGGEREGLITYMRTDSLNIARSAQEEALKFIRNNFGKDYAPAKPNVYKTKVKGAQEAHEAIRPTMPGRRPEELKPYLKRDQYRLYVLIWQRFIASQMAPAVLDTVVVDIKANEFMFRATGQTVKFPGFMKVYIEAEDNTGAAASSSEKTASVSTRKDGTETDFAVTGGILTEKKLPLLTEGEELSLLRLIPEQHFTQPPPRYTEATLIRDLEKHGIGRPSTYAPIISTIQERNYVRLEKRYFYPEEIGYIVNDLLVKHFPDIVDIGFTARMEEELDDIAAGARPWEKVIDDFYRTFSQVLSQAARNMERIKPEDEPTDETCPDCGQPVVIKTGRYGRFYACSGFPKCRYTRPLEEKKKETVTEPTDLKCEKCGQPMVIKMGRRGKFLACSGYPKCKNAKPLPTGVKCPAQGCSGELVRQYSRRGQAFYGCSNYPRCKYTTDKLPETTDSSSTSSGQ